MSKMTKKILILNGNPKSSSYNQHLADVYEIEAREHFEIKRFNLSNMAFNPSLDNGYDSVQDLEPSLAQFQTAIVWADHIVIFLPIWWGGIPAKLKGLFDRAFIPGFAFKYEGDEPLPLLKGKTSRLVVTMDAPANYAPEQAAPTITQLDHFTLQFCGIEKAKVNLLGSIISSDSDPKRQWNALMQGYGNKGD